MGGPSIEAADKHPVELNQDRFALIFASSRFLVRSER
jgi:hypothetical protein